MAGRKILDVLLRPARDFLSALELCLQRASFLNLTVILLAMLLSWWIYVPLHELIHAFGCIIGGGQVSRLDISPLYGAAFLKRFFPFISVGSEYAGQLKGFNTFGNDLDYLLTDFAPFVLTVAAGLPLLYSVGGRSAPLIRSITLGAAIPVAFAPFVSLTGDYYEMGSIIVSRAVSLFFTGIPVQLWRSDDVLKLVQYFFRAGMLTLPNSFGVLASFLMGAVLAIATYWSGVLFAVLLNHHRKSI